MALTTPEAAADAPPAPATRPAATPTPRPQRSVHAYAFAVLLLGTGAFLSLAEGGLQAVTFGLWVVAYAGALLGLLHDRLRHRALPRPPLLVLAVVALALASTAWSVAPDITVRRAIALAGTVAVGLYLAAHLRPVEVFDALRRVVLVVAVASVVLWLARSPLALDEVHGTLRGVVYTKNTLGRFLALGILAALAVALIDRGRRRRALVSAALLAAVLPLTDSAGGVVLAVVGAGTAAIVATARHPRWRIAAPGFAALTAGALVALSPHLTLGEVTGALGRDATLTGRTEIWDAALAAIQTRPALGFGYGAFWNLEVPTAEAERIRTALYWEVSHAHNGVLDVALDLGWVGAALALAVVVLLAVRGLGDLRARRLDVAALRLTVAGLTVVANVVETGLLQQNSLWTVLLVIAAAMPSAPADGGRGAGAAPRTAGGRAPRAVPARPGAAR